MNCTLKMGTFIVYKLYFIKVDLKGGKRGWKCRAFTWFTEDQAQSKLLWFPVDSFSHQTTMPWCYHAGNVVHKLLEMKKSNHIFSEIATGHMFLT